MTKKLPKNKNNKLLQSFSYNFSSKLFLLKNNIFLKKNYNKNHSRKIINKKNINFISTKKYLNFQNIKSTIKSIYSKKTNYDFKKKDKIKNLSSMNNINYNDKNRKSENNKKLKFFTENNKIIFLKVFKENELKFDKYNFIPQIIWQEDDNDILSNDEQINKDYKKSIFNLFNTLRKIKTVPEYLNKKLYNELKFKMKQKK